MLFALILAVTASLVQSVPGAAVEATGSTASIAAQQLHADADSVRVARAARKAQEAFEWVRRRNLPREFGLAGHPCDVVIRGRWCVWSGDDDREPPPESPRIRDARERLLQVLDSLSALRPTDLWIVSQQVRYLLEAGRYAPAVGVAERCVSGQLNGRSYFCHALAALALHDSGAAASADSAFTRALAAMPDSVRCRWTNISVLLDGADADRYEKLDCAGRASAATGYWRLAAPLYLVGDGDWRSEYLARTTRIELEQGTRTVFTGASSDAAFQEMALRYGLGEPWYSIEEPAPGSMREAVVASHDARGDGFNFIPESRALASPEALREDDWDFGLRTSHTRYAPGYARHFRALGRHQIALFRRGDSTLVVAAYDVAADTALGREALQVGLFAAPLDSGVIAAPSGVVQREAQARGVLTATTRGENMIVSVELLNSRSKSAARARYAVRAPSREGRISLSDLLMFSPRDSAAQPHKLADVLPLALPTDHVAANRPVGLLWETYGVRSQGEVFAVSLTVERIRESWVRRAAQRLGLSSHTSPLRVQWQEVPDGAVRVATRAVTVDLSRLEAGRYQVRLTLTPRGEPPVTATREITVER
jgi:hypothetical protein